MYEYLKELDTHQLTERRDTLIVLRNEILDNSIGYLVCSYMSAYKDRLKNLNDELGAIELELYARDEFQIQRKQEISLIFNHISQELDKNFEMFGLRRIEDGSLISTILSKNKR